MVLFWPILAPKYEVPKLNTPKYVTLQKLTAKIEHYLNIFLYLYSLVCTFLSYFFPKKTLSITVIHVYTHIQVKLKSVHDVSFGPRRILTWKFELIV
jgi:hypothetical protein